MIATAVERAAALLLLLLLSPRSLPLARTLPLLVMTMQKERKIETAKEEGASADDVVVVLPS
jgi:hypothetical protein